MSNKLLPSQPPQEADAGGWNRRNVLESLSTNAKDRATSAWFQELARTEEEGDAAFARARPPLFRRAQRTHVRSDEERRRMDNYESIDYSEPQSTVYKKRMAQWKKEPRWLKWVMFIAVGICVGLWSVLLFQTLEYLERRKRGMLRTYLHETHGRGGTEAQTVGGGAGFPMRSTPSGVSWAVAGKCYIIYILWCAGFALLSSLCCLVMPTAAGSGVPEVMAYLNGVMFPRVFNIRNLIVKTLSCIFVVSAGVPVGAEGPIIHIGSLIGAGLPTGRSRTLNCGATSLLSTFRNPRDMRSFISAGAACGVTSAFSAPIGGLLFVMEEVATFFSVRLACMVFVSCLACMCVIQIVNSYMSGWHLLAQSPMTHGEFLPSAIAMFIVNNVPGNHVPLNVYTFIPTVVGSLALGLLAVLYTVSSVRFLRWRRERLFPNTFLRVLEPCLFSLAYNTVCYVLPLAFGCIEIPPYVKDHKAEMKVELFTEFCADRENTFNPLATLALMGPYNSIRVLFSRHTTGLIPWYACLLQLMLYTFSSSYAGGMFVSCGTVIPSLFIGAMGGRLVGTLFNNEVWADPGVLSLIGAASYFSGISRLSFSLIVIMMEMTADLTHITCLMVGVVFARALADRFCHSLYHSLLDLKSVPFLEAQTGVHKFDMFCAKDVMTSPAVTLNTVESIAQVVEVLQSTQHNTFPVVAMAKMTYKGVISRSQLELLLWFMYFRETDGSDVIDSGRLSMLASNVPCGGKNGESVGRVQTKATGIEVCESEGGSACGPFTDCNESIITQAGRSMDTIVPPETNVTDGPPRGPRSHATYADLNKVRECIFWRRLPPMPPVELLSKSTMRCHVDLSPYVDLSTYYVRDVMCISRTYYIFRHLGLRLLPVVDRRHRVIGVITRTNLFGDRLQERLRDAEEAGRLAAVPRAWE
ncbi:chloride channel protein, putative [Trypanosoma brucei gambiense DAL972]|uniref:Chloride channel protein n=1 Tax=Trypanosoma brucei gambiense (strain MHOM/CI/86/DAL972) TaxID=679716 RepID=D0AAR0_TRYB9|nr:chloride channel protein, putative [Trypanosoma brucei gambiense DAL972]CBH18761.1 chloride channel protein, putative [Trypanosoma brucei gambiense DAL972]|eukprot:XP_011781025.1 chloride channel protein, putative [Trypanosoma brucei gambiense DAL972]